MEWYIGLAIGLIAGGVFFGAIAWRLGFNYRKKSAEQQLGYAEDEAKRIINEALKTAESKKKEAVIEAKEEIIKNRNEADRELRERRSEVQRQEKRIVQKEESLDKKIEQFERKEESLNAKLANLEAKNAEVEQVKKAQLEMLERISGYSTEKAKEYLLQTLEDKLVHEKAVRISAYEENLRDEQESLAREVLSVAVQKMASDYVAETAVSVVPLPNDDMKGRIIGREGRNIRTIETLTGVDIIIDDTPEAITISCFEPVRREIARQSLEKLISDGRIHPARIEETVEKARRDVEATIKQEGEKTVMDLGLHGIHPEIVKLIGRLRYRTSYGQNVLKHSIEVANISAALAAELGSDVTLAKRAGLLHDIGKALDHEFEGSHIQLGVDFAKKHRESDEVVHAIAAHHGDVEAKTVTAFIVQAADAISAARPGARRENLENYIKRLERLEELTSSFNGVEKTFAIQAGREIRVMVRPEDISDDQMTLLAREIAAKIEEELEYPGQIKVNVVRESRAVDYAK
ncbi:MAG: ribonuclease Y [Clostridia bacterium]|nr:ribonuclease Y [Clostridia bacterium]